MAKLTLNTPINVTKNHVLTVLNFRDYTTAGDYLVFDKSGGHAQTIGLIASLTNTDESVINLLHGDDYHRAAEIANKMIDADYAVLKLPAPAPEADPETRAEAAAEKSPENSVDG